MHSIVSSAQSNKLEESVEINREDDRYSSYQKHGEIVLLNLDLIGRNYCLRLSDFMWAILDVMEVRQKW